MPISIGQSIGRYHILEPLGQGGMATVYKVYDTRLDREVAIKFIRTDQVVPAQLEGALKRFEREAKALGRLNHPNIVRVHDYGEYEGAPYLVMEFVPGGTLKARIDGKPMPYRQATGLLLPVARALAYAHSLNIIHRDVKPSNILLTASGEPMLSDFGVAKILQADEQTLTGTGVGIGTPEYMAPEQWMGKAGAPADIYALGVVLYELLTGKKPYTADTPAAILIKQINDPLPPPRVYAPELPVEVERVLYKALAKEPADRYLTMAEFAAALERLGAFPAAPVPWQPKETPAPALPPIPGGKSEETGETTLIRPSPNRVAETPSIPVVEPKAEEQQKSAMQHRPMLHRHRLGWAIGAVTLVVLVMILAVLGSFLGWFSHLKGYSNWVNSVVFSPDGQTLASGSGDSTLKLWRASDSSLISTLKGHTSLINSVAFSPDGKTLASGSDDGTVKLWRVSNGGLISTLKGHTGYVRSVAFSPDGATLASGSDDHTVKLWRVSDGSLISTLEGHTGGVLSVAFSPDGLILASGSADATVKLWYLDGSLIFTLEGHTNWVNSVAFSPDGTTLVSGSGDNTVKRWQVLTGSLIYTLKGHTNYIRSVAISPDGKTLASGSDDATIKLWQVSDGSLISILNGHKDGVLSVAFSPDSKTLGSGSYDGTIRLWGVP